MCQLDIFKLNLRTNYFLGFIGDKRSHAVRPYWPSTTTSNGLCMP